MAMSKRYPAETITDADDLALLANTSTQVESLLHSLEQAAGSIGFHANVDRIEYMCFDKEGNISTLNSGSLQLVEKFMYPCSSVSSTENAVTMCLVKVWTAIDRL